MRIHPYELSYYNELIGGPRGAWERGFELSYWYDAFNGHSSTISTAVSARAEVDFLNDMTKNVGPRLSGSAEPGHLARGHPSDQRPERQQVSVRVASDPGFQVLGFTRLLFAMRPWFASEPRQLDGAQVAAVADPGGGLARWALQLLLDAPDLSPDDPPAAPAWVQRPCPLARASSGGTV